MPLTSVSGIKSGGKVRPERIELEDAVAGDGPQPKKGQDVSFHYTGWLALTREGRKGRVQRVKGQEVDSSHRRNTPFKRPIGVGKVIKGLDYAIMRMVENEKATWFIPAELGYGAAGAGGIIPPDADLIYEIDLMEVHEMQEKAPTRGNQKKNKERGKEQDHVQSSEGETIVGESEEHGEGQARRCVCM